MTTRAPSDSADEEAREEPAGGRYSAAEIKELAASRSEVKSAKSKKKGQADEEQMSQDAVNEMFNARNEE